jgi:tetratricopeptide (TPR) repeat protein
MMPKLLARLLIAVCLLLPLPVLAGDVEDKAALDQLFVRLARAPDQATAQKLDRQIWSIWTSPSDPDLAARMLDVFEARDMRGLAIAIELLDELVVDYPDYAEGWNQRATLHFFTGNYEASLADCARVLALEPRHFGALSGQAVIHLQMGRRDLALKSMSAALAVHPFLSEAELFPELQREMTRI